MRRRRSKGRNISGIILLDKPSGISSNDALQQVKRLFGADKAGHTGSLDPLASGMLPICFGEATKFSQFLLNSDKRYIVTAQFGQRTDTSDSDGEVVSERPVQFSEADLRTAMAPYIGDIKQIPSMFSALKHNGQPLYKLARQGIEVEREARDISVYEYLLLSYDAELHQATMEVHCSKGTYVRTLIDDLGEDLGCGAHVIGLRRNVVAEFPAEQMLTMEQLHAIRDEGGHAALDQQLMAIESTVRQFQPLSLSQNSAFYLLNGQPVQVADAPLQGMVALYQQHDKTGDLEFIGVGEVNADGLIAPKRLVAQQA